MKKIIVFLVFLCFGLGANAQYAYINDILSALEERRGLTKLDKVDLENKTFVIINDFEDHTERKLLIFKGNTVTYVEMFDDKATQETSSNVFSGDMLISSKGVISVRCDVLEGKKIPIPVVKTLIPHKQKDIIYLVDINSKSRWIDQKSLSKSKKNNK